MIEKGRDWCSVCRCDILSSTISCTATSSWSRCCDAPRPHATSIGGIPWEHLRRTPWSKVTFKQNHQSRISLDVLPKRCQQVRRKMPSLPIIREHPKTSFGPANPRTTHMAFWHVGDKFNGKIPEVAEWERISHSGRRLFFKVHKRKVIDEPPRKKTPSIFSMTLSYTCTACRGLSSLTTVHNLAPNFLKNAIG